MRFATAVLLSTVAAASAAATAAGGNDQLCPNSHWTQTQEVPAQRYNAFDTDVARGPGDTRYLAQTQTQNQTPEAIPKKTVQKRTDSSTPVIQVMSSWRQVIGGIAIAVLVAVI